MLVCRPWVFCGFKYLQSLSTATRSFQMTNGIFAAARVSVARESSLILSPEVPIEEDVIPCYNSKVFYPVNPGDVLHNRYKTVSKVGWGTSSTVWLAQDLNQYASKIPQNHNSFNPFTDCGKRTDMSFLRLRTAIFPTRNLWSTS